MRKKNFVNHKSCRYLDGILINDQILKSANQRFLFMHSFIHLLIDVFILLVSWALEQDQHLKRINVPNVNYCGRHVYLSVVESWPGR